MKHFIYIYSLIHHSYICYIDQNDAVLKKPLFSDNDEDDDESDVILSDDEKTGQWRKERFKRESYLSQVYNFILFFSHCRLHKTYKIKDLLKLC